ncbi:MAG: amidohydrolase family protein [Gammaproteobacteria bacterium]|nr:amidohydrolase family protein [Gammaproteobacteria bacterium]
MAVISGCGDQSDGKILLASAVITMESGDSYVNAIAIDKGKIKAVGEFESLIARYPNYDIDREFAERVIVPGFIDPHIHMLLGALIYSRPFLPPWDMQTPSGLVKGLANKEEFLAALAKLEGETEGNGPLIVYGYHNLVHGAIDRHDLDKISKDRPILVWHYSGHDFYLNSEALDWAEVDKRLLKTYQGIELDSEGELTGRLVEDAPKHLLKKLVFELFTPANVSKGFDGYEKLITENGVTAVAELGYGLFGKRLEDFYYWLEYKKDDPYDLYLIPEHRAFKNKYGDRSADQILELSKVAWSRGDPRVLPRVKFFSDGAFYSQTMKLLPPGYACNHSHGVWATNPDILKVEMLPYWKAGLDFHIHSNGDASQSATLEAMRFIISSGRKEGQRFIIEHGGLLSPNDLDNVASMSGGVSAASHYVHYMGKKYQQVLGDKANHITPMASALAAGIPATLHSDAPLAPLSPLQAASVHMTRLTREGDVMLASERLTAKQGLAAITINAAWTLGLEDEIGSIKSGKRANLTILDRNPLETVPEKWPQIGIWGVVIDGQKRPL